MTIPLTYVEAPDREPRPNTSLDVLPITDVAASHFVGYTYVADPCAFPNPLPKDCYIQIGPTAGTAKTFGGIGNEVITQIFGAYQGIECQLNGDMDGEFRELAQRVLENGEHRVVDGALAAILATAAAATTPATATTITSAIGVLEQYLAGQVPGQGYIYLTPLAATFAAANHLLLVGLSGELTTHLGTPVVVLTEPSMVNVAYASGPVHLWRGPVTVNNAPNVTVNKARAIAERLYSLNVECGAWKITFTPTP